MRGEQTAVLRISEKPLSFFEKPLRILKEPLRILEVPLRILEELLRILKSRHPALDAGSSTHAQCKIMDPGSRPG